MLLRLFSGISRKFWSALVRRELGRVGRNLRLESGARIIGGKHIVLGENFSAGRSLWLAAIREYRGSPHQGCIEIGDGFNCGDAVHIASTRPLRIGNNVLVGSFVHITDHSHGNQNTAADNGFAPIDQPLHSSGGVVIDDEVWICDGVVITGGVHVGRGAVIGANSVVTRSVPAQAVVAGAPARVIRIKSGRTC